MKEIKETISIQERRAIAEHCVREVGYKNGLKFKVMDTRKIIERIKEQFKEEFSAPFITIVPISEDKHKVPSRSLTFQKDPITEVYYGILLELNDYGNPKWQKVLLNDSMPLDMSKDNDILHWAVLRFNPDIQGSPFQKANPYYKVLNPLDEAKTQIDRATNIQLALDKASRIKNKPRESVNFLRFLGVDLMDNSSMSIINGLIANEAVSNPKGFVSKWDSNIRSIGELFFSAKSIGIISEEPNQGFVFGRMTIGQSETDCIKRLYKDNNIASAIKMKLESDDKLVKILIESYENEKAKINLDKGNEPIDDDEL